MLNDFLRSLPYIVHTNRELGLMLKGVKPLAIFSDEYDCFPDVVARYLRLFDRHVASGALIRSELVQLWGMRQGRELRIHKIYFTLPGEEWRVDAMIALMDDPQPWSDAKEREMGRLLGYTAWQQDVWMEHVASQRTSSPAPQPYSIFASSDLCARDADD